MTGREVAQKLGLSETTTYRVLAAAGVAVEKRAHDRRLKLSPAQVDDAIARYESGEELEFIAITFGVTAHTVLARLRERGVTIRSGGQRAKVWNDEQKRAVVSLYAEGFSQEHIAKEVRTTQAQVSGLLRREGADKKIRRLRAGAAPMPAATSW